MERSNYADISSELKKLGSYQVGGGIVGLMRMVKGFFLQSNSSGLTLMFYLLMISFFSYSVYCGVLCLNGMKKALQQSQINQILQVFGIALMGFAFQYVAGVYLFIGLDLANDINITFGAGISTFNFNINKQHHRVDVSFNLVAFAFIYWIDQLMKKVKLQASQKL